ncbi:hypothetical protein MRX96_029361 [Rhipicephalus microplus]
MQPKRDDTYQKHRFLAPSSNTSVGYFPSIPPVAAHVGRSKPNERGERALAERRQVGAVPRGGSPPGDLCGGGANHVRLQPSGTRGADNASSFKRCTASLSTAPRN